MKRNNNKRYKEAWEELVEIVYLAADDGDDYTSKQWLQTLIGLEEIYQIDGREWE